MAPVPGGAGTFVFLKLALFGIRTWFWVTAIINLAIVAVAFFVPAIMNIESNHNGTQAAPAPATVVK